MKASSWCVAWTLGCLISNTGSHPFGWTKRCCLWQFRGHPMQPVRNFLCFRCSFRSLKVWWNSLTFFCCRAPVREASHSHGLRASARTCRLHPSPVFRSVSTPRGSGRGGSEPHQALRVSPAWGDHFGELEFLVFTFGIFLGNEHQTYFERETRGSSRVSGAKPNLRCHNPTGGPFLPPSLCVFVHPQGSTGDSESLWLGCVPLALS